MSRVYFHSKDEDAELRGAERAHMGGFINDIVMGLIGEPYETTDTPSWLRKAIPPTAHPHSSSADRFLWSAKLYLCHGDQLLMYEGKQISAWTVSLNTIMSIGNDQAKLFARLHGQCEIHCWVDGEDRNWLADIIEKGRKIGLYRADMGWESVVALLRKSSDGPVVCSYSVCEQFPNAGIAGWEDENDGDDWYNLSEDRRWQMAMMNLRDKGGGLQLKPDNWDSYRFGHCLNLFDVMEDAMRTNEAPVNA